MRLLPSIEDDPKDKKNCKRFKILKALLTKTGLHFVNISVEYGWRNIHQVYRKTNDKQKTNSCT
ncbi:hypothetical protein HZS_1489 [Henneguya salminicola]|nr:hypothetical protein HZS_1489 [Henneguya salminicola]